MEPLTLLIGLATIVGTGALTKVGENLVDEAPKAAKRLFEFLKRQAPASETVRLLESGGSIDYGRAYLELQPIVEEPAAIELLEAIQVQVAANPELAAKVQAELDKHKPQISTVIENYKGIIIKDGGTGDFRGSTFNF
jgi:hypothetical protein